MIEKLEEQLQTHEVFQDLREIKDENELLKNKMEEEAREYLEQINTAREQTKLV